MSTPASRPAVLDAGQPVAAVFGCWWAGEFGRCPHVLAGDDERLHHQVDVDIRPLVATYADALVRGPGPLSAQRATSQSTSLPQACQPGRFRRANSSRYGPGEQRSMIANCSSGLWL